MATPVRPKAASESFPREDPPAPVTFERLRTKEPIERTVAIVVDDDQPVTVRFRSIGSKAYSALVDAHQEGKERGLPFNPETFGPALVAASAVEPVLTPEQVTELWDEWNTGELLALFAAALDANTSSNVKIG